MPHELLSSSCRRPRAVERVGNGRTPARARLIQQRGNEAMKRHLVCGVAAAVFGTFGTAASAAPQADSAKLRPALTVEGWKPPLGADGLPTNPIAPEGQNGGEAD